jgi:CheY-like chemotaxis protein
MWFRRKKITEVAATQVAAELTTRTESQDARAPRKKILVVDDDPVMVKTLSLTLNAGGYNVVAARDGATAIGVMRDEKPDLMLVDVCLPTDVVNRGSVPWDGFQITRWIQRVNSQKIPTLIISGADKPEYQRQAVAAGAEGFLSKPLNKAQLLNSVESALAKAEPATGPFVGLKMAN